MAPWTPARKRAKDDDSDATGDAWKFRVDPPKGLTARRVIAWLLCIGGLSGGGFYIRDQVDAGTQPFTVTKAWKQQVDDGLAQVAALKLSNDQLRSEFRLVIASTEGMRSQVEAMNLVLLYRDRWQAKQAGDLDEMRRVQVQIDMAEKEMRKR